MASILTFAGQDLNKLVFSRVTEKQCTFVEAIVDLCEIMEIEPSAFGKHLNKQIRDRLKDEFAKLHMLKKTSKGGKGSNEREIDLTAFMS